MQLHALSLSGYRNLTNVEFLPDPDFNILWGLNAQGKTNILEAIYLLGALKSFRTSRTEDLIEQGRSEARIQAHIKNRITTRHLDYSLTPQQKSIRVDAKPIRKASDVLGIVHPILFSPEEIHLLKGSPGSRRDFIDRALLQYDPTYLERFQTFLRVLKQRNRVLKESRNDKQLQSWTEALISSGARIRADRFHFIEKIRPELRRAYTRIAASEEIADLLYTNNKDGHFTRELAEQLHRVKTDELRLGQTLAGPHRDDPQFLINEHLLKGYGSQGQQRSFILAFKTAHIRLLEQTIGDSPILLLDDITSELDSRRKSHLFQFLRERHGQVFLTTTDPDSLRREGLSRARFFHVDKGQLHHE